MIKWKILGAVVSFFAVILFQGCASSRLISLSNGALASRYWYGDRIAVEYSVSPNVESNKHDLNRTFSDGSTSHDFDDTTFNIDIGVAAIVGLFRKDKLSINTGIKYTDHISGYFSSEDSIVKDLDGNVTNVYYYDEMKVSCFNNHSISLIFPEVEYEMPFMDNLKLFLSLEILSFNWVNTGGYYSDTYSSYQTTTSWGWRYTGMMHKPGIVSGSEFKTADITLGSLKIGLMLYY
jgi:hypothetical protein